MMKQIVLNELKRKLEKESIEKVKILHDNKTISQEKVVEIMKMGEKEFVEKLGRHMTYSEIREMYG